MGAMTFRERPEHEIERMGDDELIAYLVAARNAGRGDEARKALGHFAFRRLDDLTRRALLKVERREDAEDLAMQTIKDVLEAAFEGTSPGEAVNLMKRILSRRIADFYRERERKPPPGALPEESGDPDSWQPDAAVSKDDKGQVLVQDAIDREYDRLSAVHRRAIDLRVFEDLPSQEAADLVNQEFPDANPPMSAQNVDQIASRFRKALRGELDHGG